MTKREGGENTLILYHAGKEVVEYPEVRKMKYTKDFSWGFYCTKKLEKDYQKTVLGFGRV